MEWKNTFLSYDSDKSGDLTAAELRDALAKSGFRVATPVLSAIVLRYANKEGKISIDDFFIAMAKTYSAFSNYPLFVSNLQNCAVDDWLLQKILP